MVGSISARDNQYFLLKLNFKKMFKKPISVLSQTMLTQKDRAAL